MHQRTIRKTRTRRRKTIRRIAKGFSTISSHNRLSRIQKKQLEKDLDNLVKIRLKEGITNEDISKQVRRIQAIFRGRATRKQLPEKIKSIEKYRQRKFAQSIGPKFYKTLTEIPPQLLNKLLSKIIKEYNIEDTDVKDTLIATIIGEKYSLKFNTIVDIIMEINKHIIKYLREWINQLSHINSFYINPRSDNEDDYDDNYQDVEIGKCMNKINNISKMFIPLLVIRYKIKSEYFKILSMIKITPDSPLNIFFNTIDINWPEELDKAKKNRIVRDVESKINEMQYQLDIKAETAKIHFRQAVSSNLVLTDSTKFDKFDIDFNKIVENIYKNYHEYKTKHAPQKSKSKSKSKK